MPCYTQTSVRVDLSKAVKAGAGNVFAALKAMGVNATQSGDVIAWYGGWINTTTGEASVRSSFDLEDLQRNISKQVVFSQAKRFGWAVKEQKDGKLLVQKNSF